MNMVSSIGKKTEVGFFNDAIRAYRNNFLKSRIKTKYAVLQLFNDLDRKELHIKIFVSFKGWVFEIWHIQLDVIDFPKDIMRSFAFPKE